jgi:GntR family transcriptional regulator/MocR family aminotransferase
VQAVLAEFISSGEFNKHLRKIRQIYLHRQEVLIESLRKHFGEVEVSGTEGGMHIIWTLPPDIMAASELRERALRAGVGIYPLGSGAASFIANDRQRDRMVMLGFSSVCESDIRKGVEILAKIARSND